MVTIYSFAYLFAYVPNSKGTISLDQQRHSTYRDVDTFPYLPAIWLFIYWFSISNQVILFFLTSVFLLPYLSLSSSLALSLSLSPYTYT